MAIFKTFLYIVINVLILISHRAKNVNATFSNANQEKKIKIISIERMNEERVEKRRGPKKVVELFDEQWACSKSSDSLSQFQTNERIRSTPF